MTAITTDITLPALDLLATDMEALLADLDATEIPAEAPADEAIVAAEAPVTAVVEDNYTPVFVEGDLKEMASAVPEKEKTVMIKAIANEFSARSAYEARKNPDNLKMSKNLDAYAKKMGTAPLAAILAATAVDPDFINREIAAGKRFNVYAIDKVNDILTALETGHMKNEINRAVMLSLFKFRAAGVPFTGAMAIAAASDKVKVEKAVAGLLVRYTVSAATAPTQCSSTMNALSTLGVVVNRGTAKFPVWALTDTPQTRRLEEVLAA